MPVPAASLELAGYNTLDRFNGCTDSVTLTLYGIDIFLGSFDRGSSRNAILLNPKGTTNAVSHGFNMGGLTRIRVPPNRLAGANTVQFSYARAVSVLTRGHATARSLISSRMFTSCVT